MRVVKIYEAYDMSFKLNPYSINVVLCTKDDTEQFCYRVD